MASIVGLNEVTLASSVGGLTVESIVGILVDTLHLTSALGIWGVERGSESGPYIGAAKGGNLDNLTLSNAFTVDLWARSDTAGNKFLISKEVGTGANGWAFYVDDSGRLTGYVFTDGISNAYTWTGRNRFSPDELWRHVALYYDDEGDRKVYLSVTGSWQKDTQVAANGNTVGDSDYDFIIGQRQDGSWRWDGAFSMVRVSRGDRFNHGVNFSPPSRDQILLPDEDTLYLWNFSDGEGNISEEIEGRTAIISGSATWVLDLSLIHI